MSRGVMEDVRAALRERVDDVVHPSIGMSALVYSSRLVEDSLIDAVGDAIGLTRSLSLDFTCPE